MPGVTIGDESVIGAGAVAAEDVPSYGIALGNPTLVIRPRFSPEIVERLLAIRRRDWPAVRLLKAASLKQSPDIGTFIETAEAGSA